MHAPCSRRRRVAGIEEAAGHALITDDFGASCPTTASPYINDCDHDQAGAILQHIYGSLNAPVTSLAGQFVEFDQHEFIGGTLGHSMADVGYAYVPAECSNRQPCKAHIFFHGCKQTTKHIGDEFYIHAGYNEWADANSIIVSVSISPSGAQRVRPRAVLLRR